MSNLIIPLKLIQEATNNFHQDNLVSTGGGLGPAYKGRLFHSGEWIKIVARRLDRSYGLGEVEFLTEVSVLSDLKHQNLVSMIGYCDEENEKIIITSYEAKGSLSRFVNSPNLTWARRLRICLGVASALSYLHSHEQRDYVVIHRNINSYTILLDENWEPKLSGFEISLKQPVNRRDLIIPSEAIGMEEYTDPVIEKLGGVTCKSDLYSFGVVMFELLCGRLAFNQADKADEFLAPLAKYHYENAKLQEIIIPDLRNQNMSPQSLVKYSAVAYSCIEEEPRRRQDLDYIVHQLEKALRLQLMQDEITGKNLEHMKVSLSDIKLATEDFSKRYEIRSTRSYNLYSAEHYHFDKEHPSVCIEGRIKVGAPKRHTTLLIKRFSRDDDVVEEMFYSEVNLLTSVQHRNIVPLLGFCVEGYEMINVMENLPDRHLAHYFQNVENMRILTWERRVKICIDVARALNYLHYELEDQKTISGHDINIDNIVLDESWGAKVFGFPNLYAPPLFYDLITMEPDVKSDVYSFGVVMFELVHGRSTNDPIYAEVREGFPYWAKSYTEKGIFEEKMLDPIIKEETREYSFTPNTGPFGKSIRIFIEIAYQCVKRRETPGMNVVFKELQRVLCILEEEVQSPTSDQDLDELEKTLGTQFKPCLSEEEVRYPTSDQDLDELEKTLGTHFKPCLSEEEVQYPTSDQDLEE